MEYEGQYPENTPLYRLPEGSTVGVVRTYALNFQSRYDGGFIDFDHADTTLEKTLQQYFTFLASNGGDGALTEAQWASPEAEAIYLAWRERTQHKP